MCSLILTAWAKRWGVPHAALVDLQREIIAPDVAPVEGARDETDVQNAIRLEASRKGLRLWRNNVGALPSATGGLVRFGLANDSAAVNRHTKSGDLIGIRPVTITADMVGGIIGQFVSRECKRPDWMYRNTERERAQTNWAMIVIALGGDAAFANGGGTL